MRRALVNELPALSRYYGLTPADVDVMTVREIRSYLDHLNEARAAASEGKELI